MNEVASRLYSAFFQMQDYAIRITAAEGRGLSDFEAWFVNLPNHEEMVTVVNRIASDWLKVHGPNTQHCISLIHEAYEEYNEHEKKLDALRQELNK